MIESYKPLPTQAQFHKSQKKFRAFVGGFGSGKTMTLVWDGIDKCLKWPGFRWGLFRDTLQDLRDTTMTTFFEECPPELIYTYRKKDEKVILINGSEILFRSFRASAGTKRNQFEGKIKGLNLGGFGIDEGNECEEHQFNMLQARLRQTGIPWHGGWLATNPPNEDHWIYKKFDGPESDKDLFESFHASTRDNPHLPPNFITDLEKEYAKSPGWIAKFIDGAYGQIVDGDPVYDMFLATTKDGREWHTRKNLKWQPAFGPVHRYWDFGWHRPAVLFGQVTPDGRWKIYKEFLGNNIDIYKFAERVIKLSNEMFRGAVFEDYGDPAGKQKSDKSDLSSIEILKNRYKIHVHNRYSRIREGTDIIAGKMRGTVDGEPTFQVDTSCTVYIQGLEGGYCRPKATDGSGEEPIKDGYFEHLQDAARYGAINLFGNNRGKKNDGSFVIGGPNYNSTPAGVPGQVTPTTQPYDGEDRSQATYGWVRQR